MKPEDCAKSGKDKYELRRIKYNLRNVERMKARVKAGLCRDCGKCKPVQEKTVCEKCAKKRYKNSKIAATRNKAKMCCHSCRQPTNGKTLCQSCHDNQIVRMRDARKRNKILIYNHFGGKCEHCGETDIRVMTLDHVDNDGAIDKKSDSGKKQITTAWYVKLVRLINSNKSFPRKLQMLCYNCHFKKDLSPWWT
jgi:hypothetical protein